MWIVAALDITAGEEIVYDYGDKPSNMEWRKFVISLNMFMIYSMTVGLSVIAKK